LLLQVQPLLLLLLLLLSLLTIFPTATLASGYPLENHKVVTSDGWVLNLYRIPHGKNRNTSPGKRPVIYLHHGITLSSACFTLLNENESMAYILADAGGACQPVVKTTCPSRTLAARVRHN
jgi:hypothetical protein